MKDILIIEDDMAISHVLATLLRRSGYNVRQAANGQDGLTLLSQKMPALILCDVMMPILDGRAVCRHIQATPRYHAIPLVMMSAVLVDLSGCPCTAFLHKPFDLRDLLDLVTTLIGTA